MDKPLPDGFAVLHSRYTFDQTVSRLVALLEEKSAHLFIVIDHSGEALRAGLKMPPTKLLLFGNPRGGTPLMIAAPSSAIDLPLKILVAQDEHGTVSISYNTPEYLGRRHSLPPELLANIAVIGNLAKQASE